ncbi:MAG: anaerobic sulfatase maturase [Candidatus Hydrogenedens sp.]|nr:anaerobic sulfatase maturase [Candidatus Hydrogenedens sp.]
MNEKPFHIMAKPVGPSCNLMCKYCFYYEKKKVLNNYKIMSDEVLETYVREYITANPANEIVFGWQGGEPTLAGIDFFEKVLNFQKKYKNSKQILNTLQTNGILLNEEWADFLRENGFLVGISIDGPKSIHDKFRTNNRVEGTLEKVYKSVQLLKEKGVEFNTLTCVHRHNWMKGKEIYHFLKYIGSQFMQFIPIIERRGKSRSDGLELVCPDDEDAEITEWTLLPEQWGYFLNSIFDEWIKNDVGTIFVQLFDMTLAGWMGLEPPLCVHTKQCGNAMILEADGSVYSCDHFVYPEYYLGNIKEKSLVEIVNSNFQKEFGKKKLLLTNKCKSCKYLFACNGGCIKHRFVSIQNEQQKQNYLCHGYFMFFQHTEQYMKLMAQQLRNGLPPANVMDEIKRKQNMYKNVDTDPNAPCPCGSGKKYKKCCGSIS